MELFVAVCLHSYQEWWRDWPDETTATVDATPQCSASSPGANSSSDCGNTGGEKMRQSRNLSTGLPFSFGILEAAPDETTKSYFLSS
jgi:hypothetical protein